MSWSGESPDLSGAEKRHRDLQPDTVELGPACPLEASTPIISYLHMEHVGD